MYYSEDELAAAFELGYKEASMDTDLYSEEDLAAAFEIGYKEAKGDWTPEEIAQRNNRATSYLASKGVQPSGSDTFRNPFKMKQYTREAKLGPNISGESLTPVIRNLGKAKPPTSLGSRVRSFVSGVGKFIR